MDGRTKPDFCQAFKVRASPITYANTYESICAAADAFSYAQKELIFHIMYGAFGI